MPESKKSSTASDPHLWVTVLAGGVGSRFWPASTPTRPKQLLPLGGPRPLVVETVERARVLTSDDRIRVLAGEALARSIRSALPSLGKDQCWVEPQTRGTGAALTWAAWMAHRADPEAVLLSLHSDHVIHTTDAFVKGARAAAELARREGLLVAVGVRPTRPETAYGYLRPADPLSPAEGVATFRVASFREKPDRATADRLIAQGHLWNTGIFAWRADVFLSQMERHAPEIAGSMGHLDAGDPHAFFAEVDAVTVDKALLERSDAVGGIVAPFSWDDVGSWEGLARGRGRGAGENVVVGAGHVFDGSNNIVYAEHGALVLWGLDDVVAVRTEGVTLVMRRDLAPDLKRLLERLPEGVRQAQS